MIGFRRFSPPVRALLWKEWRQQRWRGILAVLVLASLSASLVRAQLMPTPESVLLIFGPLGLLLAIFMAMGTVATEREDGTWGFLTAKPTSRKTILRVKWAVGAANLLAALFLAGVASHAAATSRGLFNPPLPIPEDWVTPNSASWLWIIVAMSSLSLFATYSLLFLILTRARTELLAGLGGVLVTFALLAWLGQFAMARFDPDWIGPTASLCLKCSATPNPLSPVFMVFARETWPFLSAGAASAVIWILGVVFKVDRFIGERE